MLALELAPVGHQALGDESTLDEMIVGAWEGLTARRTVPCPCCGSQMAPHFSAGGQPLGGRCADCDSELA